MAEPSFPIRDPVQADEAVPEDAHPRGTLVVITLFGLFFALTWLGTYLFVFLERGAPRP
jgi:hypothetical protein